MNGEGPSTQSGPKLIGPSSCVGKPLSNDFVRDVRMCFFATGFSLSSFIVITQSRVSGSRTIAASITLKPGSNHFSVGVNVLKSRVVVR